MEYKSDLFIRINKLQQWLEKQERLERLRILRERAEKRDGYIKSNENCI